MASASNPFTTWTLISRSVRYYLRSHAAVALGIAASTAVIVGALVVGDSVRGSLRGLVLNRLGNIEYLLHSRTFFDESLITATRQAAASLNGFPADVKFAPVILLPNSTAETRKDDQFRRAAQVQVLGVDDEFWQHIGAIAGQDTATPFEVGEDEVALNEALARELNVQVGDELTVRVTQGGGVPADNPLGKRDANIVSLPRQKVVAILPDGGVGGVSFTANQSVPRNVYAALTTLQDLFDIEGQANAIAALSPTPSQRVDERHATLVNALNADLRPRLEGYGLKLEHHVRQFPDADSDRPGDEEQSPTMVYDYYQLSSNELLINDATAVQMMQEFESDPPQRVITYLANTLVKVEGPSFAMPAPASQGDAPMIPPSRRGARGPGMPRPMMAPMADAVPPISMSGGRGMGGPAQRSEKLLSREVPYSIIVGVDGGLEQRLRENYTSVPASEIRPPACWINSWLAEQLDAKAGDWVEMRFFEPETVDGDEVERVVQLFVAGVVPLTEPSAPFRRNRTAQYAQPPTEFNDPNLTPMVPGVTDQESISNWDLPFELEDEDLILPVDDEYWNNHRLTPKLFITYRTGVSRYFFSSRFGNTTAFRWPADQVSSADDLRSRIESALLGVKPAQGLVFTPVRMQQLQAASGTTPFDMLFLSLSFFVIVAALMLVSLLFRLGLQQRTSQIGLLLAQGFRPSQIRGAMLGELSLVAVIGAIIGVVLGLAYARLMIAGLESWWIGAITTRFLRFEFSWLSLAIGAVAGILTSLLAIYSTLRQLNRARPLAWMRGNQEQAGGREGAAGRVIWLFVAFILAVAAGVLMLLGAWQSGMARAGNFFGSGMLLLAAALIAIRQWLAMARSGKSELGMGSLMLLALRSISRNPGRSSLTLGLLAVASFLIASMGVFQMRPSERGYGGFDLLAQSSQPIYRNIASANVRRELLGERANLLRGTTIIPMRERRGGDASCNNLFQVGQPTILGVPELLQQVYDLAVSQKGFEWAASASPERPWAALQAQGAGTKENPLPVILDQNTAAWSLKQGASLGSLIELDYDGRTLYFTTVGLLSNSVLQGKLMISEENFVRTFPELSGSSFFLINTKDASESPGDVAAALEDGWSDSGLDVTYSVDLLEQLLGVQNTYISAFQSLGALGLLLGTFGLAAAQIRSVVERRRELALMQAVGFSSQRIGWMITLETALLLGGGLIVGCLCASLALLPYVFEVGPQLSFFNPLLMLLAIFAAGFLAGMLAVRTATRQSVLSGLRNE